MIPKKIKVCGHTYQVDYPYKFSERSDLLAQADFNNLIIRIADQDPEGFKRPKSAIWAALIHELIHVADHHSGHDIFQNNEPAISGIAEIFFSILIDNGIINIK